MADRKISEMLGDILENIKEYLQNYAQYFGYLATEKGVKITSFVLTNFIVALASAFFLNIVIIALTFYFGYVNDAIGGSFLFIAIFYVVLSLIFIIFRKPLIKKPLQRQMVRFVFTDWNSED